MVSLLASCRKLVVSYTCHLAGIVMCIYIICSCDFNLRDKDGRTALHIAVTKNNSHIVKLLISKGIDTTIKDNAGKTAEQLSYDLVSGHTLVYNYAVQFLSSAGKYKLLRCACYCNTTNWLLNHLLFKQLSKIQGHNKHFYHCITCTFL